ncbi:hypothetical protein HID58_013688 [Brassica napus]|uniref:Uncharacterized protein n=1 Tax=Brassica napus TaxID=3708 RepID=A0ABQ8E4L1_BRANA|nr:hypothetical protein HID58_013688 [Brassica napus]
MVVETRRGKRKENPTEEEGPRVKFAKTGSGENVEKTTTEEGETRAVEITTDGATEKTRNDSSENTAEMTEPFNVVAEAAPTTLNKSLGDEENEETASRDEENEETASGDEENEEIVSGDEENEETASGDEVNEKTASGDEVNESSEEEQEKPDGEKESSNQDHEDSEEEPPDRENEVNARSEEQQANGEGEEEANENGNPPEPQENYWKNCQFWYYLEGGEQSIQLGDVMKLVKRTLKLMSTVDKKVDQLDGRLVPLEEFVKEAQAKAVEEEAPAQEKAKKQKRRKK